MPKLHEILAVESHKQKQANKILEETSRLLDKEHLYKGSNRKLVSLREQDSHINDTEVQEVTSTVQEVLEYAFDVLSEAFDAVLTKEHGNQIARADVVVGGKTLFKDVPATFLLYLEGRLVLLRTALDKIPTLAPGETWVPDTSSAKEGVYMSSLPHKQIKTKKDTQFEVVVEPTDKHPAHVERVERTVDVGVYTTVDYSGMFSPAKKARVLSRLDNLLAAVKAARMRANSVNVEKAEAAQAALDYILLG